MRKINPLNDLAFKKVMGERGSEVQLKSFLEAVLGRELKSVEIQGAMELTPDIIGNKLSRLDVFAKTDGGTGINIEVQLKDHKNMGKRTIFYWGRTFGNSLKSRKENDYSDLPDTVTVNILGFDYIDGEPEEEFHNIYHVRNDRSGKILDKCFEVHFIEMPKFLKLKNKDMANKIHRWLAFFDNDISDETLKELMEMDTAIKQAQKKIEYISYNEEDYRQIMLREQALIDYQSDLNAYRREGRLEGKLEGRLEGKLEGRLEGKLEGRLEGKQDMITAMKKSGMTDEAIEKIISLTERAD
jgi:predicted transposase/invertase (TIGR01784 family)